MPQIREYCTNTPPPHWTWPKTAIKQLWDHAERPLTQTRTCVQACTAHQMRSGGNGLSWEVNARPQWELDAHAWGDALTISASSPPPPSMGWNLKKIIIKKGNGTTGKSEWIQALRPSSRPCNIHRGCSRSAQIIHSRAPLSLSLPPSPLPPLALSLSSLSLPVSLAPIICSTPGEK